MLIPIATSIMDALPHLGGMLMVITTLGILWGVCAVTAKLINILLPNEKATATPSAPQPAANSLSEDDHIPSEIAAVIAAAVVTVTGRAHQIVSIKHQNSNWERAGRQSILTSHRIR